MQIIERTLRELRAEGENIEGRYAGSIVGIEKREEEEGNATVDVGVGSLEMSNFEGELERERQESVRLHK